MLCKEALAWHSKSYDPEGLWKAGAEADTRGSRWLGTSSRVAASVSSRLAPALALFFLTVTLILTVPVCKMGHGER